MTLQILLNRACTIVRRLPDGTTDEYGNDIPAEELAATVWELQQTQRTEPGDQGEVSITTWLAIFPAGTDLSSADAILDGEDGHVYELVGAPWAARNPRTQAESHVEVTVKRTAGVGVGS